MSKNNSGRPKITLRQKVTLIIFGILCCILLIEIGLRVGGFILTFLQEHKNKLSLRQGSTYRIMCLGESTTADGGVNSYPSQLENILNQHNIGIKFSVINKGVFGCTTNYILSQLEDNLNQYNPEMVITMMGIDDYPEILPYHSFGSDQKIVAFFKDCRVYKLLHLLKKHIVAKIEKGRVNNIAGDKRPIKLPPLFYVIGPKKYYIDEESFTTDTEASLKINIELNPKDTGAYLKLGEFYKLREKYNSADNVLKKAIEINPRSYNAHLELGLVYLSEENYPLAEEMFKRAIEIEAENYRAYVELGWYYVEIKSDSFSEEMFKKAIELNPKCEEAYVGLGRFYTKKIDYVQAEEMFKKARRINSENYKVYLYLGEFYASQDKYLQAIEAFKKSTELNPRSYIAYVELGWCYLESKEYLKSEEVFKKAIELSPESDNAYGAIEMLYKRIERLNDAEQYKIKGNEIRRKYYNPITRYNYQKLKAILDKRGIKLVCAQYPRRSIEPLKKILEEENGIIFVANVKPFEDLLSKDNHREYFKDMFAGDFGHCTPKGNRLLAENIAKVILKECFNK